MGIALLAIVAGAYFPAWRGEMVWDDDTHITPEGLQSAQGLWRIWTDVGATPQYYPVLYSAFWVEHRLWGDRLLPYHMVNIVLHALSALLVAMILRRLGIPGAALAALIFAVHPVCVESVAWITEQKNTLSGFLALGSVLAYLRFVERRLAGAYVAAVVLFVLAVLSKSATAVLPAGLGVILWWRSDRLRWRKDILPLVPLMLVGLAAGLGGAWVESAWVGARGADFQLSLVERVLLAGRAILFYLQKILIPVHLVPLYPRWNIDQASPIQYSYPLAVAAIVACLWAVRKRSKAPLAAMGFFCVMVLPGLGFVNIYMFINTFVADRWQYLAALGPICLVSGAMGAAARSGGKQRKAFCAATAGVLGLVLVVLTWQQSRLYARTEGFYRGILEVNPESFAARYSLGAALEKEDQLDEAILQYQQALQLRPDNVFAHHNLASVLARIGRYPEALEHARQAVSLEPEVASMRCTLGNVLAGLRKYDQAIGEFNKAIVIDPAYPESYVDMGVTYSEMGQPAEAAKWFLKAIDVDPSNVLAHYNLGRIWFELGRREDARRQFERVLKTDPTNLAAAGNLAGTLYALGRYPEAVKQYQRVLELDPRSVQARVLLAKLLGTLGRTDEAMAYARQAVVLDGRSPIARNALGVLLARRKRFEEAAAQFETALRLAPDFEEARRNLVQARAILQQGPRGWN